MENQEQTKVLCVRTIDGVNIPITRIRQLYLERPEKPDTLVGEMRFCAVIGEQEDSAFHYFDPEDCIKFRLHDTCGVYDDSITTVDLAKKVYPITDHFTQDEMCIFLYGSDTHKQERPYDETEEIKRRCLGWLFAQAEPEMRAFARKIYEALPKVAEVIEI